MMTEDVEICTSLGCMEVGGGIEVLLERRAEDLLVFIYSNNCANAGETSCLVRAK